MMVCLLGCAAASGPVRVVPPTAQTLPPRALLRAPGSFQTVRRGQSLWRIARAYGMTAEQLAAANALSATTRIPAGGQLFIPLPTDSPQFYWPLLGEIHSAGGLHGVEITAPAGSVVRAARRGQVAVATQALAGRGPTLVLMHENGYVSVYAGVAALLVPPGAEVAQGSPIAELGTTPLHFEIRHEALPVPVLSLLPGES